MNRKTAISNIFPRSPNQTSEWPWRRNPSPIVECKWRNLNTIFCMSKKFTIQLTAYFLPIVRFSNAHILCAILGTIKCEPLNRTECWIEREKVLSKTKKRPYLSRAYTITLEFHAAGLLCVSPLLYPHRMCWKK